MRLPRLPVLPLGAGEARERWDGVESHRLVINRTGEAPPPASAATVQVATLGEGGSRELRLRFTLPGFLAAPASPDVKAGVLFDPVGDLSAFFEITFRPQEEPSSAVIRQSRNTLRRDPRWRPERLSLLLHSLNGSDVVAELTLALDELSAPLEPTPHEGRINFFYAPPAPAPLQSWSPTLLNRIDIPTRFGFLHF